MRLAPLIVLLASCAMNADVSGTVVAPRSSNGAACSAAPPYPPTARFRHKRNRLYRSMGEPRFRGIDLIAMEGDEKQTLGGKLAYTAADKDVWDEDVLVYGCLEGEWRVVHEARTNREGRFTGVLTGEALLPVGMHDLYLHVPGDGGGVRFLALVAARGTTAIVSDVDGTITEAEDAIFNTVLWGDDIGHQPNAPEVFAAAGRPVIYLTARGDQYTEVTRLWLAVHGFPRGPLRLAPTTIKLPGAGTVAFKTDALRALAIPVAAGIGNRASDILAYTNLGLRPEQIFINLPEFDDEVAPLLGAGRARAFDDYAELPALLARGLPAIAATPATAVPATAVPATSVPAAAAAAARAPAPVVVPAASPSPSPSPSPP